MLFFVLDGANLLLLRLEKTAFLITLKWKMGIGKGVSLFKMGPRRKNHARFVKKPCLLLEKRSFTSQKKAFRFLKVLLRLFVMTFFTHCEDFLHAPR